MNGDDFTRGFQLGAMFMRERAAQVATDEVLFAMGARPGVDDLHPDGTACVLDLPTYWTLRVSVARLVADEIYHLPILEPKS